MPLDVALILELAPLARSAVKTYLGSNLARNLDKRVRAQIEADPALQPIARESLLDQWQYLHTDGRSAVIIAGLLAEGDVAYLDALERRAMEMLTGLETLELGVEDTVQRVVAAVRNNFVAAQRDDKEAAQRSTSAQLSAVEPLARRADVAQLSSAMGRLEDLLAAPVPRVLILPNSFDEDQQRLLAELKSQSETAAARLAQILNDAGIEGVVSAVRAAPAWAAEEPAVFWRTAGRVLLEAGRLADAERAFVREADTPGATNLLDALSAAARIAEADKRPGDAAEHLKRAQAIDADHPAVALFAASRSPTAEERLELASAVAPRTDGHRAHREKQRALALLDLGRFEAARDAANASAEASPAIGGQELATLATIWRARELIPVRDRDDRPLIDAARYHLSLHHRQLELGNLSGARIAGARAALATAILGDLRAAREAIDRVIDIEGDLDEDEARSTLLSAAVAIGDGDRALALVRDRDGSVERDFERATVELIAGRNPSAAAILDEMLPSLPPGGDRQQAVAMRVSAACDPSVSLDPALAADHPDGAALLAGVRAQRAHAVGDLPAARAHLTGMDDPPSLILRSEIAEAEGKLSEAVGLQAALTRQFRTSENLLRLAGLRARAGDFGGAVRDALRLATDDRKLRSVRDAAFETAAQAAADGGDFEELEDIAERWAELSPDRDDPPWAQVFALARQNRHQDALLVVERRSLEPTVEANRHRLVADLYLRGISDARTRLRALRDLSLRFGRPIELERAFISGVLQTPDSDRPDDEELIAHFQEAFSSFEQRFPDSGAFTTITIDSEDDGGAIIDKLAALQTPEKPEAVEARQDAIDGVRQGRYPVGFLAAMVGRSTAETIVRTGAHPLGTFYSATHEPEVVAAGAALDAAAASWDETACITVGLLDSAMSAAVIAALPGSMIGQTVRDSLNEAVHRQLGGEQVATMHILPDGTPQIIEENPETVSRAREAERAAEAIASKLAAAADRGLSDDQLATMVAEARLRPPAAAAVSAMVVARHHDLALFSDDRVLRAFARAFGMQAFGTVALIDALERRGTLVHAESERAIESIIDLGVWGLALDPARYVGAARRAGYDLARIGPALLNDQVLMNADSRVTQNALLLRVVAEEAPDKLVPWANAIVLAYREHLQMEPLFIASLLLATQLDPDVERVHVATRRVNTEVAAALRAVEGLGASNKEADPVVGAARRWLSAVEPAERDKVLARLLAQFEADLAAELRAAMDPDGPSPAEDVGDEPVDETPQ